MQLFVDEMQNNVTSGFCCLSLLKIILSHELVTTRYQSISLPLQNLGSTSQGVLPAHYWETKLMVFGALFLKKKNCIFIIKLGSWIFILFKKYKSCDGWFIIKSMYSYSFIYLFHVIIYIVYQHFLCVLATCLFEVSKWIEFYDLY